MVSCFLFEAGALHGIGLARTCGAINNNIAILTLEKGPTKLFTTLVKNLILCCLVIENLFKVVVSLSIIKVIIGLHCYLFFILINLYNFSLVLLRFQKRPYSGGHFYVCRLFT